MAPLDYMTISPPLLHPPPHSSLPHPLPPHLMSHLSTEVRAPTEKKVHKHTHLFQYCQLVVISRLYNILVSELLAMS